MLVLKVLSGVVVARNKSSKNLVTHPSQDASCLRCHCGNFFSSDLRQQRHEIGVLVPGISSCPYLAGHHCSPTTEIQELQNFRYPLCQHNVPTRNTPAAHGFYSRHMRPLHPVLVPLRGTPGTRAHRAPKTTGLGPPGPTWSLSGTGRDTGSGRGRVRSPLARVAASEWTGRAVLNCSTYEFPVAVGSDA